jgi:hypothetical protein
MSHRLTRKPRMFTGPAPRAPYPGPLRPLPMPPAPKGPAAALPPAQGDTSWI